MMCCCGKPTINGEPGCKMTFDGPTMVYPPNPPALLDGDVLLFDEPGRCGKGLDSHAYHYRLVSHSGLDLLVRHGAGDERFRVSYTEDFKATLAALDSNARYWIFNAIFHAHSDGARRARETERAEWEQAAAEKRIKTRRLPRRGICKVWIERAEVRA